MKKLFILLTVSLLLVGSSHSQVKISGGLLGGLNIANLSTDPEPTGISLDNLTGFAVGGVLNFEFSSGFCIQAEPMYLQGGAQTTISEQGINVNLKLKTNYISIPVLLTYVFQAGENQIKPYIFAGPSLGILVSATASGEAGGITADFDIKDSLKTIDFSALFGAGVNIPVGSNTIFVEGRYSLGFININNSDFLSASAVTIKTKGIQFFAGIRFPFGS
jgi:Outer membrane protein beta-barrel domain